MDDINPLWLTMCSKYHMDAASGEYGSDVAFMGADRSCTASFKLKLPHGGSDKDKDYLLTIIFNL